MTASVADTRAPAPFTLTAFMLGNIVIGAGVLAPGAMMNTLTADLAVSPVEIGALIAWGAVVLCIGAPTLAYLTGKLDRRAVLVGSLALYAVGHAASAFATDYAQLLTIRVLMIVGAAVYTPQAASAVTLMIGPERRAAAVAYVFIGWSIAGALVSPILTIVADQVGWRAAYGGLAAAAVLAAVGVMARAPARLVPPPVSLADWRRTLTTPAIMILLATTMVQVIGQFTLFPYLAAELQRVAGADAGGVAAALAVYGASGLIGAAASQRFVGGLGAARVQIIALATMAVGLVAWGLLAHQYWAAVAAVFVWGLGFAAAVSMQQARLIAVAPALASASVAFNTSFLYLGQAIGASIGARLIEAQRDDWLGFVGCAFMLAAIALSTAARRRFKA
jgi:predicted MFS family arabinose efflux permease